MSCASSTFEVGELVRFQARFDHLRANFWPFRPAVRMGFGSPMSWLSNFVARYVDNRVGKRLALQAAFFHGIAKEIDDLPPGASIKVDLVEKTLKHVEADVSDIRDATMELYNSRANGRLRDTALTQSLQRVARAADDSIAAIQAVRAAVASHQAQLESITAGDEVFSRLMLTGKQMDARLNAFKNRDFTDLDEDLLQEARETLESISKH